MQAKQKVEIDLSKQVKTDNILIAISGQEEKVSAKIIEILGKNKIIIEKNNALTVNTDIILELSDGRIFYQVEGRINKVEGDQFTIVTSDKSYDLKKRKYFRLNINEDITFSILNNSLVADKEFPGSIEDISTGGIKLITEKRLAKNNEVILNTKFNNFPFESIFGKVVRVTRLCRIKKQGVYDVGIQFLCTESERNKISQYINNKLMEYRRLGML